MASYNSDNNPFVSAISFSNSFLGFTFPWRALFTPSNNTYEDMIHVIVILAKSNSFYSSMRKDENYTTNNL